MEWLQTFSGDTEDPRIFSVELLGAPFSCVVQVKSDATPIALLVAMMGAVDAMLDLINKSIGDDDE